MKCYISVKSQEKKGKREFIFYVTLPVMKLNTKQILLTLILLAASGYFLYSGFSLLFHP